MLRSSSSSPAFPSPTPCPQLLPSPNILNIAHLSPLPPSLQPRPRVRRLKKSISILSSASPPRSSSSSNSIQKPSKAKVVKNFENLLRGPSAMTERRNFVSTPEFEAVEALGIKSVQKESKDLQNVGSKATDAEKQDFGSIHQRDGDLPSPGMDLFWKESKTLKDLEEKTTDADKKDMERLHSRGGLPVAPIPGLGIDFFEKEATQLKAVETQSTGVDKSAMDRLQPRGSPVGNTTIVEELTKNLKKVEAKTTDVDKENIDRLHSRGTFGTLPEIKFVDVVGKEGGDLKDVEGKTAKSDKGASEHFSPLASLPKSTSLPSIPLESLTNVEQPSKRPNNFPSFPALPNVIGRGRGRGVSMLEGGRGFSHKRSSVLEIDIADIFLDSFVGMYEGEEEGGHRLRQRDEQFEDAKEDVSLSPIRNPKLNSPFSPSPSPKPLPPSPVSNRLVSLDDSLDPGLNHGNIGLGILTDTFETVLRGKRDENKWVDGEVDQGRHLAEHRAKGSKVLDDYLSNTAHDHFDDPPSPSLPAEERTAPRSPVKKIARLPSSHGIPLPGAFPRRTIIKSSPRPKRIYPRPPSVDLKKTVRAPVVKEFIIRSPVPYEPDSIAHGTPDLSHLPGSFIASPVLPTSFPDFGHSPLPTPLARFSRVRRNGTEQGAATLTPPVNSGAPGSSSSSFVGCNATTTAAWMSSSAVAGGMLMSPLGINVSTSTSLVIAAQASMPSSPLGTPTLASPHVFSPSAFGDHASDLDITAPSTPVPDSHVTAMPTHTSAAGNAESALFDAAIASTIIGAIVCLGAVGWFAYTLMRRKASRSNSQRTIKAGDYYDDHGGRGEKRDYGRSVIIPRPPPLARLPLDRASMMGRASLHEDGYDPRFDGWADCDDHDPHVHISGDLSEDHGGYPEMVARADGLRHHQRSSSRTSRTSIDTMSTKQNPRRRSSLRASTPCSIADSTFSRQSVMSSRTSHGVSPTPPRLPSPVGIRYSGDGGFFCPPETPTRKRTVTTESDVEPPVPVLPLDFRELASTSPTRTRVVTPSRSSSKSSGKSGKSTRSPAVLHKKRPDMGESSAEAKARKLEKRRATVDGVFGDAGNQVQPLLFRSQLGGSDQASASRRNEESDDPFEATVDIRLLEHPSPSQPAPSPSIQPPLRKSSLSKKVRPVTMPHLPPAIVVSDHPQELVPPPTPVKAKTTSEHPQGVDPRFSMKTYDTMPWLSQSPSLTSAFTANMPRDDCSILDPDMRSQKHISMDTTASQKHMSMDTTASQRHISLDTTRSSVYTVTQQQPQSQQQQDRYSADLDALRYVANVPFAAFDRRGTDDDRSVTSVEATDLDTEDEQMLRNQRRRTLLYSVYKQRGVNVEPLPIITSPSVKSLIRPAFEAETETLNASSGVTKRQSLITSFPSPPTPNTPTFGSAGENLDRLSIVSATADPDSAEPMLQSSLTRFSRTSFDIDIYKFPLERIESTESLRALARSQTYDTVASRTAGSSEDSLFNSADSSDDYQSLKKRQSIPALPASSSGRTSPTPPRPSKSPSRQSAHFDDEDVLARFESSPPRQPLVSRIPVPIRSSTTSPIKTRAAAVSITPPAPSLHHPQTAQPRSFAADLQDSVGLPPTGYDSDSLLYSGLPNRNQSTYAGLGLTSTSLYSTNSGSIESLEDAAIETVHIRARSSGIPQFRGSSLRGARGMSGGIGYDSDESTYDESDAEMWGGARYHQGV